MVTIQLPAELISEARAIAAAIVADDLEVIERALRSGLAEMRGELEAVARAKARATSAEPPEGAARRPPTR